MLLNLEIMTDNELLQVSELIWSKLNCIENQNKFKSEQIDIIKGVIMITAQEQRKVGRIQILNHLQGEIDTLRP